MNKAKIYFSPEMAYPKCSNHFWRPTKPVTPGPAPPDRCRATVAAVSIARYNRACSNGVIVCVKFLQQGIPCLQVFLLENIMEFVVSPIKYMVSSTSKILGPYMVPSNFGWMKE